MLVNYQELIKVVILAMAVSPASLTITKTKVFKPFREAVAKRSYWLGELFSCPYCLSHWLSFGAVALFKPVVVSCGFFFLVDYAVSAFIIVGVAGLLSGAIYVMVSMIE